MRFPKSVTDSAGPEAPREGNLPTDLRGPGCIRQRQTTYWELESSRGSRYRVNFRTKAEFAFAGDEYQQALLLDQHPLLLDYKQPMQTIMISGRPSNPTDLVRKLEEEIRTQTDRWRSLSGYANMDSADLLEGGHGLLLTAPEPVCAALMPLLNDAGAKPYNPPHRGALTARDDSQRLLLLGQSYVIARAFAFAPRGSHGTQQGGAPLTAKETLSLLRGEFDAEPGSFLAKLRTDLEWDHGAFSRLVKAMHEYVSMAEHGKTIERWIAEGFWYLGHFVRDWSQHPNFPRPLPAEYYESAYERLHDLAYWLFHGESPYEGGNGFEDLAP